MNAMSFLHSRCHVFSLWYFSVRSCRVQLSPSTSKHSSYSSSHFGATGEVELLQSPPYISLVVLIIHIILSAGISVAEPQKTPCSDQVGMKRTTEVSQNTPAPTGKI